MAVPATAFPAPSCTGAALPRPENTRPRLDRCSAHRVRPDRPHRPRSRPVFGPPLRQLVSDPFHPVEGGSANDYDYCNGDPVNCTDLDGMAPWWRKALKGAAIVGGVAGTIACGATVVCGLAVGAAAGAAAYAASNAGTDDFRFSELAIASTIGAAGGRLGVGGRAALGGRGIGVGNVARVARHTAHAPMPPLRGGAARQARWLKDHHQFRDHWHVVWRGTRYPGGK